jgi:hypothetical protein
MEAHPQRNELLSVRATMALAPRVVGQNSAPMMEWSMRLKVSAVAEVTVELLVSSAFSRFRKSSPSPVRFQR